MNELLVLILIFLAPALFFAFRNECVYSSRVALIYDDDFYGKGLYEKLPNYDAALFNPRYWGLWTAAQWKAKYS